jgi:hypothetical protein
MSSPRRQLRRALEALRQVQETLARFPDARAELERALGPDGVAAVDRAYADVARVVAVLDQQLEQAPASPDARDSA